MTEQEMDELIAIEDARLRKQTLIEPLIKCADKYALCAEFDGHIEPEKMVNPLPSKQNVNWFINKIQGFIEDELILNREYWDDKKIKYAPQFDKLDGASRLAFYLEWYEIKRRLGI